jgi:predicted acyl esterase
VRIFVMGIDQWRDEQDWPLPDTTYEDYFLDGSGRANSADGDGELRTEAVKGDGEVGGGEGTDVYLYDPRRPVPTLGGRVMNPSTARRMVVAVNRVFHGPGHPSRLVLPIIDR